MAGQANRRVGLVRRSSEAFENDTARASPKATVATGVGLTKLSRQVAGLASGATTQTWVERNPPRSAAQDRLHHPKRVGVDPIGLSGTRVRVLHLEGVKLWAGPQSHAGIGTAEPIKSILPAHPKSGNLHSRFPERLKIPSRKFESDIDSRHGDSS